MNKTVIALAIAAAAGSAQAQNSVSFGMDRVKNEASGLTTNNQTLRANFGVAGFDLGVNARSVLRSSVDITPANIGSLAALTDRIETTLGRKVGPLNVYGGVGHESALAGGNSWQYGVVGARTSFNLGAVSAYAGGQTRVNWENSAPEQATAFAGVAYSLTKNVGLTAGVTKSYRDLKETSYGAALQVKF